MPSKLPITWKTCSGNIRLKATASNTRQAGTQRDDPHALPFANDFENLGGGYVVIGQDCDKHGQPIFPPVGIPSNQLDKIQKELLAACNLIQPGILPHAQHRED